MVLGLTIIIIAMVHTEKTKGIGGLKTRTTKKSKKREKRKSTFYSLPMKEEEEKEEEKGEVVVPLPVPIQMSSPQMSTEESPESLEKDSGEDMDSFDGDLNFQIKTRKSENHWYMIYYDGSFDISEISDDDNDGGGSGEDGKSDVEAGNTIGVMETAAAASAAAHNMQMPSSTPSRRRPISKDTDVHDKEVSHANC